MAYQIEYAYACHMGKVRNNNEDNFWCCGETLDAENQGIDNIRTGCVSQSELPLLAVFDGMGGESCGEVASYLAAQSCGEFYRKNKRKLRDDPQHFLEEACMEMNRAVCGYSRENKIQSMGTTAALAEMECLDAILETAGSISPETGSFARFPETTFWEECCSEKRR